MKLQNNKASWFRKFSPWLCKYFGHWWKYGQRSSADNFSFSGSRKCTRCNLEQIKYGKWENSNSQAAKVMKAPVNY